MRAKTFQMSSKKVVFRHYSYHQLIFTLSIKTNLINEKIVNAVFVDQLCAGQSQGGMGILKCAAPLLFFFMFGTWRDVEVSSKYHCLGSGPMGDTPNHKEAIQFVFATR